MADAAYWRGEANYRLNKLTDASRDFNDYLRINTHTTQKCTRWRITTSDILLLTGKIILLPAGSLNSIAVGKREK